MTKRSILPQFPLSPKPGCRCGWTPKSSNIVGPYNHNGNAGRPYYKCVQCANKSRQGTGNRDEGWITWDDDIGVHNENPRCHCKMASRQDRAGAYTNMAGWGFWTCATGRCDYFSDCRNGQTKEQKQCNPNLDGGKMFRPWLLSGLS